MAGGKRTYQAIPNEYFEERGGFNFNLFISEQLNQYSKKLEDTIVKELREITEEDIMLLYFDDLKDKIIYTSSS